ncbi:Protein of unknown function [Pyronema omphalodes CBS 100304]|uniref:Uncharacterized protein n=1 Tax=Pyronema omphalodes (strain CBS 100304) TaxID=1076935 RepID=U4LA42_PYROM|nr:Protein of unknown function [Pyronema omphalodes CBS 100304]
MAETTGEASRLQGSEEENEEAPTGILSYDSTTDIQWLWLKAELSRNALCANFGSSSPHRQLNADKGKKQTQSHKHPPSLPPPSGAGAIRLSK